MSIIMSGVLVDIFLEAKCMIIGEIHMGFTHEHWTDGDLMDASVPTDDIGLLEFGKAQYGPPPPATFGHSMPVDQVDKVRAEVPDLFEGVLKDVERMTKAAMEK